MSFIIDCCGPEKGFRRSLELRMGLQVFGGVLDVMTIVRMMDRAYGFLG
jgi:hypothetical protein